MADLCVVKPSPGKGYGVFATRIIKPGDVIMRDSIRMRLNRGKTDVTNEQVQHVFDAMGKEDQAAFLDMHEGQTHYTTKLMRIYKANAFGDPPDAFIYLKFSKLNHSCAPNAHLADIHHATDTGLIALKPIAKGEEIFISYFGILEDGSKEQRQAVTKASYGFVCECSKVCSLTGLEAALSDGRRQLVTAMMYKRRGLEPVNVELLGDVSGVEPGQASNILGRRNRKLQRPLTLHEKVAYGFLTAKLLEAEGYVGEEISHGYVDAATYLLSQMHKRRDIVVLASAQYVIQWMEAAISAMSKVRKPGSTDLKDLKDYWNTIQKSAHLREAKSFSENSRILLKGRKINRNEVFAIQCGPNKRILTLDEYMKVLEE